MVDKQVFQVLKETGARWVCQDSQVLQEFQDYREPLVLEVPLVLMDAMEHRENLVFLVILVSLVWKVWMVFPVLKVRRVNLHKEVKVSKDRKENVVLLVPLVYPDKMVLMEPLVYLVRQDPRVIWVQKETMENLDQKETWASVIFLQRDRKVTVVQEVSQVHQEQPIIFHSPNQTSQLLVLRVMMV